VVDEVRQTLPAPLAAVFPYGILLQPTDVYVSEVIHDLFHAYFAAVAPEPFQEAEVAFWGIGSYPLGRQSLRTDTEAEIQALVDGLAAEDTEAAADAARAFLAARGRRRGDPALDEWAIDVERQTEWLKGLAKYVELETFRLASETADYEPVEALAEDPSFGGYSEYAQHQERVYGALGLSAGQGQVMRFHYTGMAQAKLLDGLDPGWKTSFSAGATFLEDLLAAALDGAATDPSES
jgi:hypothetical protein